MSAQISRVRQIFQSYVELFESLSCPLAAFTKGSAIKSDVALSPDQLHNFLQYLSGRLVGRRKDAQCDFHHLLHGWIES